MKRIRNEKNFKWNEIHVKETVGHIVHDKVGDAQNIRGQPFKLKS